MSLSVFISGPLSPNTPSVDIPCEGTVGELYATVSQSLGVGADDFELVLEGVVMADRTALVSSVGCCSNEVLVARPTPRCAARAKATELGLDWDGYYSLLQTIIMSNEIASTDEEKAGMAQLLLDCQGDTNVSLGITAAATKGLSLLTKTLEQRYDFAAESPNCETPLYCASASGHCDIVKLLLEAGANPSKRCSSNSNTREMPLHAAARNGHLEVVRALAAHGAPLNEDDREQATLYYAVGRGANGDKPLDLAYWNKQHAVFEELLELGAEVDGCNTLHWAVEAGDVPLVGRLLQKGASPNKLNATGKNALHYAAAAGRLAMLEKLFSHGGDLEVLTKGGETVLHIAAECGHGGVVRELLSRGMDVDHAARGGVTPLHVAMDGQHVGVADLLLEHGADSNRKCTQSHLHRYNCSAAHIAAEHGLADVIPVLAAHGADLCLPDERGATPAHRATNHGHTNVASVISSLIAI